MSLLCKYKIIHSRYFSNQALRTIRTVARAISQFSYRRRTSLQTNQHKSMMSGNAVQTLVTTVKIPMIAMIPMPPTIRERMSIKMSRS